MTVVELGEVASVRSSLVDPSESRFGHLPHIAPDSIERDTGRLLSYKSVKDSGLISGKCHFQPGDVLYSKIRPNLNKATLVDFEGLCSADMYALRADQTRLANSYLPYLLRSPNFLGYATNLSNRANIPKINREQLVRYSFDLPDLDEQRRIAAILDKTDSLRAKRRQALAHVDELVQSTFQDKFGDPSARSSRWTRVKLGDLIAVGPQNGLYKISSEYGAGVPIVRIDSFQDGSPIDVERLKRVRVSEVEAASYELRLGDIVINRVNARSHLGKATVVSGLTEPTIFESNMMRLRLDPQRALPEYVMGFLSTPYAKGQIRTAAKDAVNQSSINQTDVATFELPLPPIENQEEYLRCSRGIDRLRSTYTSMSKELDQLFAALQSSVFARQL